jgi:hypothetical protein
VVAARAGCGIFVLTAGRRRPQVWKGRLLRFESVRGNYGGEPKCPACGLQQRDPAMAGKAYYRFRDVVTLENTASFAPDYSFGCAFVQVQTEAQAGATVLICFRTNRDTLGSPTACGATDDLAQFVQAAGAREDGTETMWAFGRGPNSTQVGSMLQSVSYSQYSNALGPPAVCTKVIQFNSIQIGAWSSTDLVTWKQGAGAQLGGFGHAANDYEVCLGSGEKTLAYSRHSGWVQRGL